MKKTRLRYNSIKSNQNQINCGEVNGNERDNYVNKYGI